jgi:hypothetical protein
MKFKATLGYVLYDFRYVIPIVYACVAVLILFTEVAVRNGNTVSSLDMVSIVTLFVMGLNIFKTYFKFYSANGVSRRTLFISNISAIAAFAAVMTLIDVFALQIFGNIFYRGSILEQALSFNVIQMTLFRFLVYFSVALLGFLITTLYYRMNKTLKIAVSVGVPMLFLNILPAVDFYLLNYFLTNSLKKAISFLFSSFYMGTASVLILAAIEAVFIWLLVRRARVKQ